MFLKLPFAISFSVFIVYIHIYVYMIVLKWFYSMDVKCGR